MEKIQEIVNLLDQHIDDIDLPEDLEGIYDDKRNHIIWKKSQD